MYNTRGTTPTTIKKRRVGPYRRRVLAQAERRGDRVGAGAPPSSGCALLRAAAPPVDKHHPRGPAPAPHRRELPRASRSRSGPAQLAW
eukprot:895362-Rhodomonas_salina.1